MPTAFDLAERLRAGETLFMSWVADPGGLVAETTARAGFDLVNLDMQHGLHDPVSIMRSIGGVVGTGKPAVVRIPVGDFAMASRALDMGASAVIAPMIDTPADARAFADAMKFPPLGRRSWGPTRAMALQGRASAADYLAGANRETLALAMIETREALDNLDAILSVDGIDGVFVGPSDLSVTLSGGTLIDGSDPIVEAPIRRIRDAAEAHGKIPAIFCASGEKAREMANLRYRLIAIAVDQVYIVAGCRALLGAARG